MTDAIGNNAIKTKLLLDKGINRISFCPGKSTFYLCSVLWRGQISTIKMINTNLNSQNDISIKHISNNPFYTHYKTTLDSISFSLNPGDQMLYVGYYDTLQSGIIASPDSSQMYNFQFASNIPCPGIPSVDYEGQVYNTIQVMGQCWLKENLNVGEMIRGNLSMSDNGIIEKYCYYNSEQKCLELGGIYQWNEMMQYSIQNGAQGICPQGWHIPTYEEWMVLAGTADSEYGIGDSEWKYANYYYSQVGSDVGYNLKSTSGWIWGYEGIDLFGFAALGTGYHELDGTFILSGIQGGYWTSHWYNYERSGNIGFMAELYKISVHSAFNYNAYSVRCIKD